MSRAGILAGKAYIQIGADVRALQRALGQVRHTISNALRGVDAIGQAAQRAGYRLVGLGVAMAGALAGPIKAASDLQETMAKFDTVYGESAAAMKQWAEAHAAAVGRSETDTLRYLAEAQDLFVPLGVATDQAQEMSKIITALATDLASFNNLNDADAFRDLTAAMTGSHEVMKKYGVVITQATLNQELFNQGIDPQHATEAAKAQARLAIILRGTTAAQGDAIRTAGSFANQLKALKAQIKDASAEIGKHLLPVLTPLIGTLRRVGAGVADYLKANPHIVRMAALVAGGALAGGIALLVSGALASSVVSLMSLVGGAMASVYLAGMGLVSLISGTLAAAIAIIKSPVLLLATALATAAGATIGLTVDFGALFDRIKTGAGVMRNDFMATWDDVVAKIKAGDIQGALATIQAYFAYIWKAISANVTGAWDAAMTTVKQLADDAATTVHITFRWTLVKIAEAFAGLANGLAASLAAISEQFRAAGFDDLANRLYVTAFAYRAAGKIATMRASPDDLGRIAEDADKRRRGRRAGLEQRAADRQAAIAAAREAWQDALQREPKPPGGGSEPPPDPYENYEPGAGGGQPAPPPDLDLGASGFNPFALAVSGGLTQRIANATERTAENTDRIWRNMPGFQ